MSQDGMSPDLSPMHTSPIPGAPLHPHSQSIYSTSPSTSTHISANNSHPGSVPYNNNNNNIGEPPTKVVPEISFDDLSASFRSLYRSMFDAGLHSNHSFGGEYIFVHYKNNHFLYCFSPNCACLAHTFARKLSQFLTFRYICTTRV